MAMPTIGSLAPAFSLKDGAGKVHTLASCKRYWVVLYFYPKDDTPGCTIEALEFTAKAREFANAHVYVYGVSPDTCQSHAKFMEKKRPRSQLIV